MHDEIKRFSLDGQISDTSNRVEQKERFVHFLESGMRGAGCVPVLDLEPQFTVNYLADKNIYDFSLSVYGVFVGTEQSCLIEGVSNGKMMKKPIRPIK